MVTYSKLKKPSTQDCLRYCKDYKTCTLTECYMRKLIKNDKIIMAEKETCDYFDNRMAFNIWHEQGDTMVNNDTFWRRNLGK